jgi:polyisoprenoid-binding protein YceI
VSFKTSGFASISFSVQRDGLGGDATSRSRPDSDREVAAPTQNDKRGLKTLPGSRPVSFPAARLLLALWLVPAAVAAAGDSMLTVDSAQSHVDISVKATVDSFVAHLLDFETSLTTAPQTGQITAAVFRFNFNSIKTGNADRDRDMNEWQQTAKFPEGVFTLAALETGSDGRTVARGQLRFHGIEKTVSFPVVIELKKPVITVDGDVTINTRDYGLPVIKKYLFLKVDPVVAVHFHLQEKPAGL